MNLLASSTPRPSSAISRDILLLLDDAHAVLPVDYLADFLLEVRATLHAPDRVQDDRLGTAPPTRAYLRAVESLLADRRRSVGPPDTTWVADFERHLDDLASRPRGATLTQASA